MKVLDIIKEQEISELKAPKMIRLGDPKTFAAYQRLLQMRATKEAAKAAKFGAEWKKAYPTKSLWLVKFLGLAVALNDLYTELSFAEEDYDNGKISQDDLQKYRQWAFGVFEMQVITPYIIKAITRGLGVMALARWIVRIAGTASSGATLGASAVALVASEAFFQWLGQWLVSSYGRDFLAHKLVRPIVETMGAWPEGIWSELIGYYKKDHPGDKAKDKVDPGEAGKKPGEQDPNKPFKPTTNISTPPADLWSTPAPVNKAEYMGLSQFKPVPSR